VAYESKLLKRMFLRLREWSANLPDTLAP
jgi:hypothetical protein